MGFENSKNIYTMREDIEKIGEIRCNIEKNNENSWNQGPEKNERIYCSLSFYFVFYPNTKCIVVQTKYHNNKYVFLYKHT
jgi:hypothetical protein